jgi:hypothetical protein
MGKCEIFNFYLINPCSHALKPDENFKNEELNLDWM